MNNSVKNDHNDESAHCWSNNDTRTTAATKLTTTTTTAERSIRTMNTNSNNDNVMINNLDNHQCPVPALHPSCSSLDDGDLYQSSGSPSMHSTYTTTTRDFGSLNAAGRWSTPNSIDNHMFPLRTSGDAHHADSLNQSIQEALLEYKQNLQRLGLCISKLSKMYTEAAAEEGNKQQQQQQEDEHKDIQQQQQQKLQLQEQQRNMEQLESQYQQHHQQQRLQEQQQQQQQSPKASSPNLSRKAARSNRTTNAAQAAPPEEEEKEGQEGRENVAREVRRRRRRGRVNHGQQQQEESASSTMVIDEGGEEEKTRVILFPCQARGTPANHTNTTGYFVIPGDIEHGGALLCSHPFCRGSVRFVYCAICKKPVARRNFSTRHYHAEERGIPLNGPEVSTPIQNALNEKKISSLSASIVESSTTITTSTTSTNSATRRPPSRIGSNKNDDYEEMEGQESDGKKKKKMNHDTTGRGR